MNSSSRQMQIGKWMKTDSDFPGHLNFMDSMKVSGAKNLTRNDHQKSRTNFTRGSTLQCGFRVPMPCEEIERGNRERCENVKQDLNTLENRKA